MHPHTTTNFRDFFLNSDNGQQNYVITFIFSKSHHFLTFSTNHPSPSSRPSWVLAEHAVIVHVLVLICSMFSCYRIWFGSKACTKSCLFAKIKRGAFASSFSYITVWLQLTRLIVIFQLIVPFLYQLNRSHKQEHRYLENNLPNTHVKLSVLQYPRHWV